MIGMRLTPRHWLSMLIFLGALVIVNLPVADIEQGAPPVALGENQLSIKRNVPLNQTLTLPTPTPREVSIRIWLQLFPSENPFLNARGIVAGQEVGRAEVTLPPVDGAFHAITLPWWQLPANADKMTLSLEGHGVFILATTVDRVLGGSLSINNVDQAPVDLVIQMTSGDRGIDRYVPVSQIVSGKPGLLGWPHMVLLLGYACLVGCVGLILKLPDLVRLVQAETNVTLPSKNRTS